MKRTRTFHSEFRIFSFSVFTGSLRLLQYHQAVVTGGLPDELLYGRMGYLYSLIFINQQLGHDRIPLQYIQQVSQMWTRFTS